MDYPFDCDCPECQASVRKYGSYSNLYYTFLNEVARQSQKEFPGLYLTAYVYSNVRTPPVGMRIEPNIVLDITVKGYRWVERRWREPEMDRILKWSSLGASWMIHDWCFPGVSPRAYMRQYASFLQWGAQNAMVGAYAEWSPGQAWYLDGAKYSILTQLMSDPYQDVDLLWKQYCDDMFRRASESMFCFFPHFARKYLYSPDYIELSPFPVQEPAMFTEEELAYERSLLEKSMKMTEDSPLVQRRLRKIARYFRGH